MIKHLIIQYLPTGLLANLGVGFILLEVLLTNMIATSLICKHESYNFIDRETDYAR